MELILKIIRDFILDKSRSIGQRAGLSIIIIIVLFSVDRVLNFTYDIHINNKLNAIEKINNLKKEYKNDSLYTIQLSKLETEYKDRKHYYDYYHDNLFRFLNFSKSLFKSDNKEIIKEEIKKVNTIRKSPIRSNFWMFMSSNFFLIIITLIFGKSTNTKESILGLFLILIILFCIMAFANWTANLIPLLLNNPIWNYILNFLIQTTLIILTTRIIIKSTTKTNA